MFRISFDDRSPAYADLKTSEIEALLSRKHVSIRKSIPVSLLHNAMAEHMGVLVNSLLALAVLMGLVGALGLASIMSMNVIERTKEIGVLRAIGGTPKRIRLLVTSEGLTVGLASVLAALGPALLLSYAIGRLVGNMAFRTPLPLSFSIQALLIWFAIIVGGSIAATILPANRAVRIALRDALSYE